MTTIIALLQAAPDIAAVPDLNARLAALETAVKNAQSAGDNAWVLVSAALVLLMTGPGLALFYGGLVRRKNILSTMMQSFAMMGLVTIMWAWPATRWPSDKATRSSADSSTCSFAALGWGLQRMRR